MSGHVLAISPHLDDAVFSAGGALAARAEAGWRVSVATMFTGNVAEPQGFALACQLDKGLGPEVDYMALRRAEDAQACGRIGATPIHLPMLEAPHRGYADAAELFRPPRCDDIVLGSLAETLAAMLRDLVPDEVWAPRALGGHVDHVLTHRAVRDAKSSAKLWWWTDWPYADRLATADPEASTVAHLHRIDIPLDAGLRDSKAGACAAYASQLNFQFGGEAAMRKRLLVQTHETYAGGSRR